MGELPPSLRLSEPLPSVCRFGPSALQTPHFHFAAIFDFAHGQHLLLLVCTKKAKIKDKAIDVVDSGYFDLTIRHWHRPSDEVLTDAGTQTDISRALPIAYPECIAAPGNEFDELSLPAASCAFCSACLGRLSPSTPAPPPRGAACWHWPWHTCRGGSGTRRCRARSPIAAARWCKNLAFLLAEITVGVRAYHPKTYLEVTETDNLLFGVNLLAIANAARSSVSKAIFCASTMSPGTRAMSVTKQ
jgi:hypothetical protein